MDRPGVWRSADDAETVTLGPNQVRFLVGGGETGGALSLTDFLMAPPPAPGPPMHVHAEEEETVYLLGGEVEATVARETRKVSTGGAVHVPRGVPHTLKNLGPAPARLLVIQSPAGAERYWAEAARLLAASDGPPDPARMQALAERFHFRFQGERRFADE